MRSFLIAVRKTRAVAFATVVNGNRGAGSFFLREKDWMVIFVAG